MEPEDYEEIKKKNIDETSSFISTKDYTESLLTQSNKNTFS